MTLTLTYIFKVIQAWHCNKTAKISHVMSAPWHIQFCVDSFHIWHKWPLAWEGVSCTTTFDLDFVIKLLKYGTSSHVLSIVCVVLDGFSPYLALMITSMRGSVLWPLCPMTFDPDLYLQGYLAVTLPISWSIFICGTNQPMSGQGQCVTYHFPVNRSKVKVTQVLRIFAVWAGGILVDHWSTISTCFLFLFFNYHLASIS